MYFCFQSNASIYQDTITKQLHNNIMQVIYYTRNLFLKVVDAHILELILSIELVVVKVVPSLLRVMCHTLGISVSSGVSDWPQSLCTDEDYSCMSLRRQLPLQGGVIKDNFFSSRISGAKRSLQITLPSSPYVHNCVRTNDASVSYHSEPAERK